MAHGRSSSSQTDLRASVVETVNSLGIRHSIMERWMFEPIAETEDAEYEKVNPGLTMSPTSSSDSRSSHGEPSSDDNLNGEDQHPITSSIMRAHVPIREPVTIVNPEDHRDGDAGTFGFFLAPSSNVSNTSQDIDVKDKKEKRSGFRRAFFGTNSDDESDGGYKSDAVRGKATKIKSGKKKKKTNDNPIFDAENETDGGYLSDGLYLSSKKSKKSKSKSESKEEQGDILAAGSSSFPAAPHPLFLSRSLSPPSNANNDTGYLTDSLVTPSKRSKKDKKGKKDDSDVPDTPSKKRGIFRMMTGREKSKERASTRDTEVKDHLDFVPPVPALPSMPLPIAQRFARSVPSGRETPDPGLSVPPTLATASRSPSPMAQIAHDGGGFWSSKINAASPRTSSDAVRSSEERSRASEDSARTPSRPSVDSALDHAPDVQQSASSTPKASLDIPPSGTTFESPTKSAAVKRTLFPARRKTSASSTSTDEAVSSAHGHNKSRSGGRSPAISSPNPHLLVASRDMPPPSPLLLSNELGSRNNQPMNNLGIPISSGISRAASPANDSLSPDSFVFVEQAQTQDAVAPWNRMTNFGSGSAASSSSGPAPRMKRESGMTVVVPSSVYLVPSPQVTPNPGEQRGRSFLAPPSPAFVPISPSSPGLALRRQASPRALSPAGLSLPTTPTRNSVLAYYDVSIPSPPPSGPLPLPPSPAPGNAAVERFGQRRGSDEQERSQFLSPSMYPRSLSPSFQSGQRTPVASPGLSSGFLTPRSLSPVPSPSPSMGGLFNQPIPSVKRGKVSPFPARPILPRDENSSMSTLLARKPTLTLKGRTQPLRNASFDNDEQGDPIEPSDDRGRSQSRSRRRVYFSDEQNLDEDEIAYGGIQDVHSELDSTSSHGHGRPARPPLEPSKSSSGIDEFFDATEGGDDDRSLYNDDDERSVYSRYSVLDPDRSATVREGFMKRVEAEYGRGGGEDIPEMPELPASLRDAKRRTAQYIPERRGILKSGNPAYF